jgi:hypothetical protein
MGSGVLERWESEVGETSAELLASVRAHPRFGEAMQHSVTKAIAHIAADPLLHSTFRDLGHVMLASLALFMDATGGLTHRRLRDLSANSGVLSSGRAAAVLLRLQFIGYVTGAADHKNGSVRIYVPTEKMKTAYRRRLMIDLEAIAMLAPEAHAVVADFDNEKFRAYMATMGRLLLSLGPRHHPDLTAFDSITSRNSGVLFLYMLVNDAWTRGAFPQPGVAPFNASAMARKLAVSRMHVLRLLREAETAGYVERRGADSVFVTPRLCDHLSLWMALFYTTNGAILSQLIRTETQKVTPRVMTSGGGYADNFAVQ